MRRFRAISPVVATALLVLIAVAVSVLLYTWVSGTVGTQPTSSAQLQERIKIDAVSISGQSASVCVHNIGDTEVTLKAIYIKDLTTNTALGNVTNLSDSLSAGEVKCESVTLSSTPSSGDTILVKAVTDKGTEATYIMVYR